VPLFSEVSLPLWVLSLANGCCLHFLEPKFTPGLAIEINTPHMRSTDLEFDARLEEDLQQTWDADLEEMSNAVSTCSTSLLPIGVETLQFTLPIRAFASIFDSALALNSSKNPSTSQRRDPS
jgi:hypothetical protein